MVEVFYDFMYFVVNVEYKVKVGKTQYIVYNKNTGEVLGYNVTLEEAVGKGNYIETEQDTVESLFYLSTAIMCIVGLPGLLNVMFF